MPTDNTDDTTDGPTDAAAGGPIDGESTDSGPTDVATDGGVSDGGSTDGESTDSGPTDVATGGPTDVATDGGVSDGGMTDVEREQQIDYMDVEINLLKPATPFMRDHLKIIWIGFGIWVLTTFAPITATRLAPDLMTTQLPLIGFPLHYFLLAIVGPGAALVLSVWYARKRDQIDEKYGIEQGVTETGRTDTVPDDAAATDGGVTE